MKDFLLNPEKFNEEEPAPEKQDWKKENVTIEHEKFGELTLPLWVFIVIGAVVLITTIFLIYICCAAAKNKRVRENADIQLELELEKAAKEGVDLPDELQKRLSDSRKKRSSRKNFAIFQGQEEFDEFEGKDGKGKKGKGGLSRYNKPGFESGSQQFEIG